MSFNIHKWNKQRYLAEAQIHENLAQEINKILPESLGYKEFAKAVATILKDEYGSQNFGPFMEVLHAELGMEESLSEEKSYDTYTVNITTADPKEGGPDEDFTEKVKVDSSLTGDDIKASIKDTIYDMGYRHLYKLNYEKA